MEPRLKTNSKDHYQTDSCHKIMSSYDRLTNIYFSAFSARIEPRDVHRPNRSASAAFKNDYALSINWCLWIVLVIIVCYSTPCVRVGRKESVSANQRLVSVRK